MNPLTKSFIYKTYVRPVLLYGCENFIWTKTDVNSIRRIEGNIVKRFLNVPTRCRTTDLFESLNIEQTKDALLECRLSFYTRIVDNELTKQLLIESHKIRVGLGGDEVLRIDESPNENVTVETIIEDVKSNLAFMKMMKKQCKKTPTNPTVENLRSVFKSKNREMLSQKIFNLIKFNASQAA